MNSSKGKSTRPAGRLPDLHLGDARRPLDRRPPTTCWRAIADGGYAGIEITDTMIGRYADRPAEFAAALEKHGLTLVAFACGSDSGFTEPAALGGRSGGGRPGAGSISWRGFPARCSPWAAPR